MVITRVAPLSLAKVALVLYALMGLVFGAFVSLAALAGAFASNDGDGMFMGALFGVGAVIVLPIFYGCMGFVMSLVTAWLYNLVSGMVGGVEVDVT
jgi:hypothetical protein